MRQTGCRIRPVNLFAIVLAAGRASRFGEPKQLQELDGQSLVARAMRCAEQVCGERTVLVTGHAGGEVHNACAPLQGFLVHNNAFASGMASSIRSGVDAVGACADGVLILLADQPLVTATELERLRDLWLEQPARPAACRYAGRAAVPAIFPRSDFAALMSLQGDRGAQALLRAYGDELPQLDVPEAAVDIDEPLDLENVRKDKARHSRQ